MKVFHFADSHFEEKNFPEIKKCHDHLIKKAVEETPDVIICSGDVTNSEYLGASTKSARYIMDLFRQLSDIAPVAVVIGTPSHDGQTPELLEFVSGKYPIHVSTTVEQLFLVNNEWWLEDDLYQLESHDTVSLLVSQFPAPTKQYWKNRQGVEKDNLNIAEGMAAIFAKFGMTAKELDNVPHIFNGHFAVVGSKISDTQLLPGGDIAINPDTLAMGKVDLICVGHIHKQQSYEIMGKEICFHSGSMYRKNFGERNEDKGFYIHDIDTADDPLFGVTPTNKLISSEFIKVPTREMHQLDIDLIKHPEELECDDFAESVATDLEKYSAKGSFIKITIKLYMDDVRIVNQAKLKRLILDDGASDVNLDIDRVRRENSREEEIIKAVTLPDKFGALEKHRNAPAPEGTFDLLESVETLNEADLVALALKRIGYIPNDFPCVPAAPPPPVDTHPLIAKLLSDG